MFVNIRTRIMIFPITVKILIASAKRELKAAPLYKISEILDKASLYDNDNETVKKLKTLEKFTVLHSDEKRITLVNNTTKMKIHITDENESN